MTTFDTAVSGLAPLSVAIAITGSCVLLALGRLLPRVAVDLIATAASVTVTVLSAIVLGRTTSGHVVAWVANWAPKHGFSVGIVLVADPVGAGLATLCGVLMTLALVYSWRYFDSVDAHYHGLMLLFLAGMQGFALTGDLFDMFVFFELMGVSAFALAGMKIEDATAVEGALNFGIINSLGAYLSLAGIAMLYARTGNLGLPQLGTALRGHKADALVVVAFVLVLTGFLVKAAAAPFHFWLDDAHAVAPAPVCVLLSGVMVPLGVYAALRVYWTAFAGVLSSATVHRTFLVLGVLTAIVGALMCLGQRHIKRLLAFSTIAHVGLFLCALSLLDGPGTAGAALYVVGHAGVKAALFLLAGLLLNRYGSVDEHELYGVARRERITPWLWLLGGLALAGLPPFGTGLGKAVSEDAALDGVGPWLAALFILVSAATGGAVLRVAARVYRGLGPRPSEQSSGPESTGEEKTETRLARIPITMLGPIVILLAGALAEGLIPGIGRTADHAAAFFTHPAGYVHAALTAHETPPPAVTPESGWSGLGIGLGLLSCALALGFAAAGLWGRLAVARARTACRAGARAYAVLRSLHSGHVGDYVAWLFTGVAILGALVGL